MTVQAQNALLKTIEEPPSYAVIILITTNQEAFLPTILSRCVQMKLKPLKDFTIKSYLTQNLHIAEKDADICAAFARGNLGKAIHLASSDEFRELFQKVMVLVKNVGTMDISMLLDCIREMKEQNFGYRRGAGLNAALVPGCAHVQGHEGHEPADFQG